MKNFLEIVKHISEISDMETVKHFIFENAYLNPDQPAFEWRNEETECIEAMTYLQLVEKIACIGTALYHQGFQGKTVAIAGKSGINWLLCFTAALCSNMTLVPLDFSLTSEQIRERANFCDVSLLFKDEGIQIDLESADFRICNIQDVSDFIQEGRKLLAEAHSDSWLEDHLGQKQIGMLIFTSGTGGMMKAAMIRQENITLDRFVLKGIEADKSKFLELLPLFHVAGITDLCGSLMLGTTTYISSGMKYFLEEFSYVKPTSCFMVPAQAHLIGALLQGKTREEGRALLGNNIVALRTSGAPLPENLCRSLADFDIKVTSDYGMTETGGPVSVSIMKNGEFYSKPGSVGLILDCISVKIDKPDPNGYGEVTISGQCVFEGYYKNEEETRKILRDGVLYTGDIGYIDEDRYLYIAGRKKNVIIREDGINVIPEELERNVLRISGVDECLVYQHQTEIVAKIYAADSSTETRCCIEAEINQVNKAQPYYKKISRVEFVEEPLPKTQVGKIKRSVHYESYTTAEGN